MLRCAWLVLVLAVAAPALPYIDTVGYTDRDRQVYGPAVRYIVNDALRGVHVVWKTGYGTIRYNFRPNGEAWRWPTGTTVNRFRRNLGSFDVEMESGEPLVGTDYIFLGEHHLSYFRDTAPGCGTFMEHPMDLTGFRHNLVAASYRGRARFAALAGDSLCYRTSTSFRYLGAAGPFPGHNVFASRQVGRFGYAWTTSTPDDRHSLYLKETPNSGGQWYAAVGLSDSVPSPYSRCLLGAAAVYDSIRLELVAGFYDGSDLHYSEIWHYAKYDSPPWAMIQCLRIPETTEIGPDALPACRPSIGLQPGTHELFAVWEQFDPDNIDPETGLARADIWASRTLDRCQRWTRPVRLTTPDESSKRFPCLADIVNDTLHVLYFADRIAGFWEAGHGPQTINAVVYMRIPADDLFDLLGRCGTQPCAPSGCPIRIRPAVSRGVFTLDTDCDCPLVVRDAVGRVVARIPPGLRVWGAGLPPGAYFVSPLPGTAGHLHTARIVKLP